MRSRVLGVMAVAFTASWAAAQDGAKPAGPPAEFARAWRKSDPETKASAFRHLDPEDPASLPCLYDGFRFRHWLVRGKAAEAAARIPEGPLRSQARLDLLSHSEDAVREGLAYALAWAPLPDDGRALSGALEDRDPLVRRDAARGLRRLPSRGALLALVRALARETDARPRVWILDTLRALARCDEGPHPAGWQTWWDVHKDDPELKPPEDLPPEKGEFAGVSLETVTVPARRPDPGRKRPWLFVLAPFGWTHDWFRPHLDLLSETFTVTYIRLPPVRDLTGSSGYGDSIPTYPTARLARAFEAMRKQRGAERVILLAEGPAAWIAETYALEFPSRAAGLVLLDGWVDAASYAEALKRMAAAGNEDERASARSLLGVDPSRRDEAEERWMARTSLTHALPDRGDLLGHHLWTRTRDPQGFCSVPPLSLDRHVKIETPALFFFPGGSPLSGHFEAPRIRTSFPNSIVATMESARGLGFVDGHDEFHRVVRGWVERFGLDR